MSEACCGPGPTCEAREAQSGSGARGSPAGCGSSLGGAGSSARQRPVRGPLCESGCAPSSKPAKRSFDRLGELFYYSSLDIGH